MGTGLALTQFAQPRRWRPLAADARMVREPVTHRRDDSTCDRRNRMKHHKTHPEGAKRPSEKTRSDLFWRHAETSFANSDWIQITFCVHHRFCSTLPSQSALNVCPRFQSLASLSRSAFGRRRPGHWRICRRWCGANQCHQWRKGGEEGQADRINAKRIQFDDSTNRRSTSGLSPLDSSASFSEVFTDLSLTAVTSFRCFSLLLFKNSSNDFKCTSMTNQTQSPLGNAPPSCLNPRNMQTKNFRMFFLKSFRTRIVWKIRERSWLLVPEQYVLAPQFDEDEQVMDEERWRRSWKEDIVRKNVEKQNHWECAETSSLTVFRNPVARPGLPKNRPTFGRRQGRGALANAELVEGSRKLTALGGYCRFDSWQAWSRKREAWRILMSTTTWLASQHLVESHEACLGLCCWYHWEKLVSFVIAFEGRGRIQRAENDLAKLESLPYLS